MRYAAILQEELLGLIKEFRELEESVAGDAEGVESVTKEEIQVRKWSCGSVRAYA